MVANTPETDSTWCAWLRFVEDEPSFTFRVLRGEGPQDDERVSAAGDLLLDGLLEVAYLENLARKYGDAAVQQYLDARGFKGKLSKRVGDFGEVLAGAAICENETLTQPIRKLRYRERADWAMRLSDVFSLRVEGTDITAFCYMSVKSGVTRPKREVAVDGYDQLLEDNAQEHPEVLFFVAEQLARQGRWEEIDRLDRAITSAVPTPKMFRLALVFDRDQWRDDLLMELDDREQVLEDFAVYVVRLEHMREVVERAYGLATERCFSR